MSLDYRLSAPSTWDTSVFRMSIGNDWTNYGDRIAYIHPNNENFTWMSSPINGDPNGGVLLFPSPPVGEWCSVEVVHKVEDGEYVYSVSINGVVKISTKSSNKFVQVFTFVSTFTLDTNLATCVKNVYFLVGFLPEVLMW